MHRVLVFPSCNEPGLEICSALVKSNKIELFAGSSVDAQFDPSRMLYTNHVICPGLYDEDFARKFRELIQREAIDIVFPSVDALVAEFAKWSMDGVRFIVPNAEAAEVFLSKRKTYARLSRVVPVPAVYDRADVVMPAFAKPDVGSGSRGGILVTSERELDLAVSRDLMLTEYLPGLGYTVDCLNDLEGNLLCSNVRLRGMIGRGIALGTKSVHAPQVERYVQAISGEIRFEGPWFAQFKESKDGELKLLEVNARVGGSMTLTRLSGVNIPLMAVFAYLGYKIEVPLQMPNLTINRCLNSIGSQDDFNWVIWDFDDTIIRKDGKPDPEIIACLYDFHNRGKKQFLLTKNPHVWELMREHHIPDLFVEIQYTEDKSAELGRIMGRHTIPAAACVAINDSFSETLALQAQYPDVRLIRPDAVGMMGKEKLA